MDRELNVQANTSQDKFTALDTKEIANDIVNINLHSIC